MISFITTAIRYHFAEGKLNECRDLIPMQRPGDEAPRNFIINQSYSGKYLKNIFVISVFLNTCHGQSFTGKTRSPERGRVLIKSALLIFLVAFLCPWLITPFLPAFLFMVKGSHTLVHGTICCFADHTKTNPHNNGLIFNWLSAGLGSFHLVSIFWSIFFTGNTEEK